MIRALAYGESVYQTFENFKRHNRRPTSVAQDYPVLFNFTLCSKPLEAQDQITLKTIFLVSTADWKVWLCLAIQILLISYLTSKSSFVPDSLLITFSALTSPGISGSTKSLRCAPPFTLWTYICLIFVTYYSGSQTSLVLKPMPERRLEKISDLVDNNFTVVFENPTRLRIINRLLEVNRGNRKNRAIIQKLLNSSWVANSEIDFMKTMATADKHVTVAEWSAAIHAATTTQEYIGNARISNRKCYVGKQLIFANNLYAVFIPPKSKKTI